MLIYPAGIMVTESNSGKGMALALAKALHM